LLEEILLKDYANPAGGYTGATRSQFDNVGDYAGYTTTGIVDMLGATVPGLGSYSISPPVAIVASTDLTGVAALRVTVSVTDPTGNAISLTGYRTCDLSPSCPLP
jgi:MSHA pilin protein MshD